MLFPSLYSSDNRNSMCVHSSHNAQLAAISLVGLQDNAYRIRPAIKGKVERCSHILITPLVEVTTRIVVMKAFFVLSVVFLGVWTVNAASLRDFERQLEEEIRREGTDDDYAADNAKLLETMNLFDNDETDADNDNEREVTEMSDDNNNEDIDDDENAIKRLQMFADGEEEDDGSYGDFDDDIMAMGEEDTNDNALKILEKLARHDADDDDDGDDDIVAMGEDNIDDDDYDNEDDSNDDDFDDEVIEMGEDDTNALEMLEWLVSHDNNDDDDDDEVLAMGEDDSDDDGHYDALKMLQMIADEDEGNDFISAMSGNKIDDNAFEMLKRWAKLDIDSNDDDEEVVAMGGDDIDEDDDEDDDLDNDVSAMDNDNTKYSALELLGRLARFDSHNDDDEEEEVKSMGEDYIDEEDDDGDAIKMLQMLADSNFDDNDDIAEIMNHLDAFDHMNTNDDNEDDSEALNEQDIIRDDDKVNDNVDAVSKIADDSNKRKASNNEVKAQFRIRDLSCRVGHFGRRFGRHSEKIRKEFRRARHRIGRQSRKFRREIRKARRGLGEVKEGFRENFRKVRENVGKVKHFKKQIGRKIKDLYSRFRNRLGVTLRGRSEGSEHSTGMTHEPENHHIGSSAGSEVTAPEEPNAVMTTPETAGTSESLQ